MAVKIIERNEFEPLRTTCMKCNSLLEYLAEDIESFVPEWSKNRFYYINCPKCNYPPIVPPAIKDTDTVTGY